MIIVAKDTVFLDQIHSLTVIALRYNLSHVPFRNPTSEVHVVGLADVTLSDKSIISNFRISHFTRISNARINFLLEK